MVFVYLGKKLYRSIKGPGKTQQLTYTVTGTEEGISHDKNDPATGVTEPSPSTCGHQYDPTAGPCPTCKSARRAQLTYRCKVFAGLILPFVVQALERHDYETGQLNWIIAAFNLTSAAFIPFWGQMADIFGRHVTMQACLVLMLVGSALCTGAPLTAFPVLLLGRAFQGLACAGINILVRVILADKVSLSENAKELVRLLPPRRCLGMGAWSCCPLPIRLWPADPRLDVGRRDVLAVISLMAVAYPFGGTLGLTVMTTVFNNASGIDNDSPLRDFGTLKSLPDAVQQRVTHEAKMGVVWAFVAITPFMILCTVFASFLGNVYIGKAGDGEGERNNAIYEGVYILSWFRKGGATEKNITTREHQPDGEATL
ncbi:putative major facilitator superfamily transporter [Colletotrichum sublineola]|uniref:Putative major facilitator superfamily transporter n=1 Tax=Colletotrichum sublineola TaxID=1173701 RepID=A0A066XCY2_COLSU|nr:putative major facilitator superfamily transporter [Colletotrichum sublineola]